MRAVLTSGAGVAVLLAATAHAQGLFSGAASNPPQPEQIAHGSTLYTVSCLSCHGAELQGTQFGPALTGEAFESHWRGHSPAQLAEKIRTTMPPGGVGSLSASASRDLEAFIIRARAAAGTPAAARTAAAPGAAGATAPRSGAAGAMFAFVQRRDDPQYLAAIHARDQALAALTPVTEATLERPPPSDWLMWRRSYAGLGFSPLREIDRSNVATLRTAWSWSLPESTNEITPLVHDGVLFIYSGAAVQALNAATGEPLWQYLRTLPEEFDNGRRAHAKSMAIYGNALFAPTADGHLVALDVRSGHLIWDHAVIARDGRPAAVGFQLTGGPIVARDTVMIGVSLGVQDGGGCYIVGLDVATGAERWRFHTIARPGEPGGDTWNGAPVNERFGAGVWTAGSYDPALDLVYFGVGNSYDTATLIEPRVGAEQPRSNDALYTDSTVALRPETGALVWYYQHQKRDVWDLDWVFEQSLLALPSAAHARTLVVTGGKTALFDALDAATGSYVFSADLGFQNVVKSIDPVTGAKTVNPEVEPHAGKAELLCPNSFGARNWPATAINPGTHVLFVPILENCADYTYAPGNAAQTARGGVDMRFVPRPPPNHDGRFGRLEALDLATRRIAWTYRQRMPLVSSALATAGGVLFDGDVDRYFYAFDQSSGRVLWRTRLNAAPESSPISYSVDGRQYVAVVTGSGSPFGAGSRLFVPEVTAPAAGVSLVVFALPGGRSQ